MAERVAIFGAGGREDAILRAYLNSPHVGSALVIPGCDFNKVGVDKPVETSPEFREIISTKIIGTGRANYLIQQAVELLKEKGVALADIAQDVCVAIGMGNALEKNGIKYIGPKRDAAILEWSKIEARYFGVDVELPQPTWRWFRSVDSGIDYLKHSLDKPRFIKADGLAEGKGALPAKNKKEAVQRILQLRQLGKSADKYLIEEWLKGSEGEEGEEFSYFVVSDGDHYQVIGGARDYKRALDNDEGENTGGMGCVSPHPALTPEADKKINDRIISKTLLSLRNQNRPYTGILYLGGMLVPEKGQDNPYIIEFNARWGDPEAQVLVPGIKSDLFEMGMAVAERKIKDYPLEIDRKAMVAVAGVSKGYPGNYGAALNKRIFGLEEVMKLDGVRVYGAGMKVVDGKFYTAGGRLFYIVGEGNSIEQARVKAYEGMERVNIEDDNLHFRSDIGLKY